VVKFEADNCFARFSEVLSAIQAAIGINHALGGMNQMTPDELDVHVSCGIDYGRFLLVEGDFFGAPVNKASKLGEDLAHPGEILVTEDAMQHVDTGAGLRSKTVAFSIAGLTLNAHRILY
jgi:class 3 adenylate cyclase